MEKDKYKFLVVFLFLVVNVSLVSSLDLELFIGCSGDLELIIPCFGDIGINPLKGTQQNIDGVKPLKEKVKFNFYFILFSLFILFFLIILLIKKRKNNRKVYNTQ